MRRIIITGTALLALAGCGGAAPEAGGGKRRRRRRQQPQPPRTAAARCAATPHFSGLPEGIPAYPRVNPGGAIQMAARRTGARCG